MLFKPMSTQMRFSWMVASAVTTAGIVFVTRDAVANVDSLLSFPVAAVAFSCGFVVVALRLFFQQATSPLELLQFLGGRRSK